MKEYSIIYDVGMHEGQDTIFYLKKGFKVVAIEANPMLCDKAAQNKEFQAYIKTGQLVVLNMGIASIEGNMDFYINNKNSEWSSFNKDIAERAGDICEKINIQCTELSNIIKRYGNPYYVKIDIEGYDHIALQSLEKAAIYPKFISVENGSGMVKTLNKMGYNCFKYIKQNNIYETVLPKPAKEGKQIDFNFIFSSSGPFGEETTGEWKSYEEVAGEISKVWDIETGAKNPNHDDSRDGWFDLHARHSNYKSIEQVLYDEGFISKVLSVFR